ncbi:MAG: ubiquinol-cytochrome C chaperone family protein [Pseudomonadota bacterium]
MVLDLLRKSPTRRAAEKLYTAVIAAARRPKPFVEFGVPDTVEGRFEMLSAHVYLILRRLKAEGETHKRFSQALFDVFFRNMDDQLREMGVGDLTVGKKIRKLAEAFYGRMGAYEDALESDDADALALAVSRNIIGATDDEHISPGARSLAQYFSSASAALSEKPVADLLEGSPGFPDYPAFDASGSHAAADGETST